MTVTTSTEWGRIVNKSMQANLKWLKHVNSDLGVPVSKGKITVQTVDSTASAIADGTMASNATTVTDVSLTVAAQKVPLVIEPHQLQSNLLEPANLAKIAANHAGKLLKAYQDLVIQAIATATPGIAETLPTGQVNFTTDGTDAEIAQNLRLMGSVVGQCIANHADLNPQDFAIVMDRRAWGNFTMLKSPAVLGPVSADGGFNWTFMGIPIYSVASSTYGLGEVSKYNCYVTNSQNLAFAWDEPYIHGGGLLPFGDSTHKLITVVRAAYGVIEDDFMGGILNSGS